MKKKITQLRWLATTLLLVAAMVMPSVAWAYNQPNGEGTKESPYQISSGDELYWFAAYVNGDPGKENGNYTACAVLTDDIKVSGTWTPIMNYSGTFDGNGHTISGLQKTISGGGGDIGLFGTTAEGSVICNVGIVNCSFSLIGGGGSVGGVCGTNNGTITNCYNTGTVDGTTGLVGGICGTNNGTITNCYNTGSVNKGQESGGVCGLNYENGTITNCYYLSGTATGGIFENSGTGSAESKITDYFENGEVAWLLNGKRSEGTTGNPLAWYQNIGGDPYPVLDSSHGTVYCGYKDCTLSYSNNPEGLSKNPVHNYDNGICKACKAYQPATLNASSLYEISNAGQLYWFAALVNGTLGGETKNASANAELTADITVNTGVLKSDGTLAGNYSNFETWIPIGYPYAGTFDGKGHTISGLYFNDRSPSYIGLFGSNSGTIKNVGVVDSYFCGKERVGGVCGNNDGGTITGCYNTGTISGNQYVGGVCGCNTINISTNSSGTITCSYNTGAVSCNDNSVGGVCGQNSSGTITNCYYLSGTATGGIGSNDVAGSAEDKTTTQFASGEVCYLLNGKRSEGTEANPLAWYQNISPDSRDTYPVLTGTGTNTVYQVEILCGGTDYVGKTYSNTNKNITVEHILTGPADFNSAKNIYYKICQREGCGKTLYYADADGTIKATPNAEKTAFAVASYTLADATEYNSKAEFTVTSLAYKRTFYDDKWMAVYVPFAIDCSKLESYYEMATINNFHEYEQEDGTYNVVLEVKRVTKGGTIPALTPCLMRMKTAPAAKVEKTLTFENAAFSAAANKSIDCSSVTRYYKFSGTLDGKTGLTPATDFVLDAGKLKNTSENTVLPAQRWYLSATDRPSTPVEPAAMLRSISINVIGDGEATGIEDIHVNTESGADASGSTGIYDLQGRKINSEPTKGMYIKNGKKYIK